jgi:hypothetical protein
MPHRLEVMQQEEQESCHTPTTLHMPPPPTPLCHSLTCLVHVTSTLPQKQLEAAAAHMGVIRGGGGDVHAVQRTDM